MDCSRVQQLISAFHDEELSEQVRAEVSRHLASCGQCAEELSHLERISEAAFQLETPKIPTDLWNRIESSLSQRSRSGTIPDSRWVLRSPIRGVAVAASILIAAGLTYWLISDGRPRHQSDAHAAKIDLAPYAQLFFQDVRAAQRNLLTQYEHRDIAAGEVESHVEYQPVLVDMLPGGFVRTELRLINMPCCMCLQAVYRNDAADAITLFQQAADESFRFEGCDQLSCLCAGIETRIFDVEGGIAASWSMNDSRLTLVGAHDMGHVVSAIDALVDSAHVE